MIYVLIKDNMVINTIVADPAFIHDYSKDDGIDLAIEFQDDEWYPGPGWSYLGNNQFQAPEDPE